MNPINWAIEHSRVTFLALVFLLVAGTIAYREIPKEASPDISIPIGYVSMSLDGISPTDSERMLVKPLEQEFKSLEGLDRLEGNAYQGGGSVVAHFETGVSIDEALSDMREKLDDVIGKLPEDIKRPKVSEVNLSLEPVLLISISGAMGERTLLKLSKRLQDELEALEEVLEVHLRGSRDEVVEIIIDPLLLQSYNLPLETLLRTVGKHNTIVPAGALDTGAGRFSVELPSLLENAQQVARLPLIANGQKQVRLSDVAEVRRSFRDYESYSRVDGHKSLTLEVVKRTGKNLILTVAKARAIIKEFQARIPEQVQVEILQDDSIEINTMLKDLQNNIFSAVILMVVILIAALGVRGGLLVSAAIPSSFVCGILFLYVSGFTVNMVVLFALILSVGILTDAAVVVTEYADRKIAEGLEKKQAYAQAANRMSLPIISSTLTTVLAFVPLMFWPGTVGEFMRYLPITMIAVLSGSLMVALIFLPVLGANFSRVARALLVLVGGILGFMLGKYLLLAGDLSEAMSALKGVLPLITGSVMMIACYIILRISRRNSKISSGEDTTFATQIQDTAVSKAYQFILSGALRAPYLVLLVAFFVLGGTYFAYFKYGNGIEFFPAVEPEQLIVKIYARGNLSFQEQDKLVKQVESRIIAIDQQHHDFDSIYASSGDVGGRQDSEDIIGTIRLDLKDEILRRKAKVIRTHINEITQDIGGVVIQVRLPRAGPPIVKAVQVQLVSNDIAELEKAFYRLRDKIRNIDGLVDFEDSTPKPGIDWIYNLDAQKLEQYNANTSIVGSMLQLATKGLKISTMRPDDSEEEIDVIARFPVENRTLGQIDRLRINTPSGLVPLNNFVTRDFRPSSDTITREDNARSMSIAADVVPGILVDDIVQKIQQAVEDSDIPEDIKIIYKGEEEKQNESQEFLIKAFSVAMFMILVVLLIQFNSFVQALLVLSAIIMSTIGVMLGHMIIDKPFSIVMSGIGVIALAGIVVNNNIILIDTFNLVKRQVEDVREAVMETGRQRLRPVLLTSFTTSLGLLPAVMQTKVDFVAREFSLGGATGQWWYQLSASIFYGLLFATVLTLLVTPTCLYMFEKYNRKKKSLAEPNDQAETVEESGTVKA